MCWGEKVRMFYTHICMRWIGQEIHIQISLFPINLWRSSDDLSAFNNISNKWVILRHFRLSLPLGSIGLRPNKRVYIKTLLTKQHKRNTSSCRAAESTHIRFFISFRLSIHSLQSFFLFVVETINTFLLELLFFWFYNSSTNSYPFPHFHVFEHQ